MAGGARLLPARHQRPGRDAEPLGFPQPKRRRSFVFSVRAGRSWLAPMTSGGIGRCWPSARRRIVHGLGRRTAAVEDSRILPLVGLRFAPPISRPSTTSVRHLQMRGCPAQSRAW